ncbi:hypothetical protein HK102_003277 [Quaeritorhiza haematococci]|nr:hypothetical protein HK102_003277 [Quaeritorhiza haematococci]
MGDQEEPSQPPRADSDYTTVTITANQHQQHQTSPSGQQDESSGEDEPVSEWKRIRCALHNFFESRTVAVIIVTLTLIDLGLVLTDISLSLYYCTPPPSSHDGDKTTHPAPAEIPPIVETLEHAFAYTSIAILSLFALELVLHFIAAGPAFFINSKLHAIDFVVVVTSLLLESLGRTTIVREVGSFLVVFRLWRIVRVVHATGEIVELEGRERVEEMKEKMKGLVRKVGELEGLLRERGWNPAADENGVSREASD